MLRIYWLIGAAVVLGAIAWVLSSGYSPLQPAAVATADTTCGALTYTLWLGSADARTGGEVSKLQRILAADKAIYPEGLVTGYFGKATERAVKDWQSAHGISATGIVGPLTRAALLCKTAPAPTATTETTLPAPTLPSAQTAAAPTCTVSVDKEEYRFKDRIILTWTSQHAVSITFVEDRSGALTLPAYGTYGPNGSLELTANVSGNPKVTLQANSDAASSTCSTTLTVRK